MEATTTIEDLDREDEDLETWGDLAPELLANVVERVQQSKGQARRVVAMAGVCRSWRRQILGFVQRQGSKVGDWAASAPPSCPVIEFPWRLMQPGPRGHHPPIQCLLTRKGNHFLLYQTLMSGGVDASDAGAHGDDKHFLLAARRRWLPTGFSYIVGKDPQDLMDKQGPDTLGKLKSNFWASEFVLWEKQDDADDDDGKTSSIPVVSLRFVEHIVNGIRQRRIQCALPQPCKAGGGLSFVLERRRLRNERRLMPASVRSWLLTWSCASPYASFKSCGSSSGNRIRRRSRRSSMLEIAATSRSAAAVVALPPAAAALMPVMMQAEGDESEVESEACHHLELRSKVPAWDAQQQCWRLQSASAALPLVRGLSRDESSRGTNKANK
ncbi:tubby-like F-box protein 13 [Selaginella moellendorffii]|uniref:tubby-like F-box protein 13 n=1 Tax=Selaginella moellendorffii TaxID=88036 RepID=UPI000D1C6D7C|nr:tubby-like F-box protein 13 [Selaginella moellendorffii]|eukprot:XP_024516377.1 tubby-like F-box protein 13 [Selaginella moellendorffii]